MEKLNTLFQKAYNNNLFFNFNPEIGSLTIYDQVDEKMSTVSEGYIKDWKWETPEETITRMHKEVDEYIIKGYDESLKRLMEGRANAKI